MATSSEVEIGFEAAASANAHVSEVLSEFFSFTPTSTFLSGIAPSSSSRLPLTVSSLFLLTDASSSSLLLTVIVSGSGFGPDAADGRAVVATA